MYHVVVKSKGWGYRISALYNMKPYFLSLASSKTKNKEIKIEREKNIETIFRILSFINYWKNSGSLYWHPIITFNRKLNLWVKFLTDMSKLRHFVKKLQNQMSFKCYVTTYDMNAATTSMWLSSNLFMYIKWHDNSYMTVRYQKCEQVTSVMKHMPVITKKPLLWQFHVRKIWMSLLQESLIVK